ncbi:MAG: hypothetical protein ACXWYN_08745 [Actinomycetota bacterium]
MRRIVPATALLVVLAACSGDQGRELARYYDPEGHFVTSLPAANDLVVTLPQSAPGGPALLTGVVASPPQPSPPPQTAGGFGRGFNLQQTTEMPDQTTYRALVITTESFETVEEMSLFFLTSDPLVDVVIDDPVEIDGLPGRLVVADVRQEGAVTASVAAAFALGDGEPREGFFVAAVFPPDTWNDERGDFLRVLESFELTFSPGLGAFPMGATGP